MKTSLFILNIVSAILLINLLFTEPTITGFAVAPSDLKFDINSPLGIALIFIIATIALDIYFYLRSRHLKAISKHI